MEATGLGSRQVVEMRNRIPLFLSTQTASGNKFLVLLEEVFGPVQPRHPARLFSWKPVNDTQAGFFAFSLLAQLKRTPSCLKALPHCLPPVFFIVMETKRYSRAGVSSWQWIGFEKGGTHTSRFLSHSGERSPLDKTVQLQVGRHPGRNLTTIRCSLETGSVKSPLQFLPCKDKHSESCVSGFYHLY